jgi:oligopeptide/dipeptide ABC transporter ATP-binding protein
MNEPLFTVRDLKKYYPVGKKKINGRMQEVVLKAVDHVSFEIFRGESLGVVGESGSGKSTLGRCILDLIKPTEGEVLFKGTSLAKATPTALKKLRRDMQMVFQNPSSSFNPKMTIGKSLLNVARFDGMSKEEAKQKIYELLNYVNLDKSTLSRRSNELSGGQLQRLAIVRALIPSPSFILADEAVSALDVSVQAQILNLLYDMKTKFGLTLLFISHELTVVEHICNRVLVMYLGSMVEIGDTEELFQNTMHPYTKALIASKPKMLPEEEKTSVPLEGEIPSAMDIPPGCRFYSRCPQAVAGTCNVEPPPLYQVSERHWVACYLAESAAAEFQKKAQSESKEECA